MSKVMIIALLAIIALTATDATLFLKRLFPNSITVNYVGPLMSVIGAFLIGCHFAQRR